jgi:hypothetical protein
VTKQPDLDAVREAVREVLRSLPKDQFAPPHGGGLLSQTLPADPSLVRALVELGSIPPGKYRKHVLDAIDEKKKPRGAPRRNAWRDLVIVLAIETAMDHGKDHGLKVTRNEEPATDSQESACDIVSELLKGEFHLDLKYRGVLKVWNKAARRNP